MKLWTCALGLVLGTAVVVDQAWKVNAADEPRTRDFLRGGGGNDSPNSEGKPSQTRNLMKDAADAAEKRRAIVRIANANSDRAKANAVGKLNGRGFTDVKALDAVPLGKGSMIVHTAQEVRGIPVRGSDARVLTNSAGDVVEDVKLPGRGKTVKEIRSKTRPFNPAQDMSIVEAIRTYTGNPNYDCEEEVVTDGYWTGWTDCGGYKARLSYYAGLKDPVEKTDEVRLTYELHDLETSDHAYHLWIDVKTGDVLESTDWVSGQLEVYDTLDLGVRDAGDPHVFTDNSAFDAGLGAYWQSDIKYPYTRGNNVCAYSDTSQSNPGDCDSVTQSNYEDETSPGYYDTNFDPTKQPYDADNRRAATVNLFFWNNLIHDFLYGYGFDEPSGNFQQDNFGNGGAGGDPVRAESQDGSGTNNANMMTPTDGGIPRMQMYRTTLSSPGRDTSLDNVVIAHEYGHGLSNRLVGGPSMNCLGNPEQAGEGWSDLLGLFMTDGPQYTDTTPRGTGTWSFNTPTIRLEMYTTDMNANEYTYGDLAGLSAVHQVGFLWATLYWEVYWELRNTLGFDEDITANGVGGNNIAVQLFVDGLKGLACRPTFIDARDAILAADGANYDGAYKCLIWKGFAKRGLGNGATGDEDNRLYSESYDVPPECNGLTPTISCSPSSHTGPVGPAQQYTSSCTVTTYFQYSVTVDVSCSSSTGVTCSADPSSVSLQDEESKDVTVTINVGAYQPLGSYSVTVSTRVSSDPALVNSADINVVFDPNIVAEYDSNLGAPACQTTVAICDSTTLLNGRGSLGSEANQPNTLDGCTDGIRGFYKVDESIERLKVRTLDGSVFAEGKTVEIEATVWAWSDGSQDSADFYHAADATSPVWNYIGTQTPSGGGEQVMTQTYTVPAGSLQTNTVPAGSLQAFRVNFRYLGDVGSCSTRESWDDRDDLVFFVRSSRVIIAQYDSTLGAPACQTTGAVCDSTTLLNGRGDSVGPEANQPNTLDSCTDGNIGTYQDDESIERIVVRTLDGSDFAEDVTVEIGATVWAWSDGSQDSADFYYAADAGAPVWNYIGTKQPSGGGNQVITQEYTLPAGSLQAVRVNFRYYGSAGECTSGPWDDRDDLVFSVGSSAFSPPTIIPSSVCSGYNQKKDCTDAGCSWDNRNKTCSK